MKEIPLTQGSVAIIDDADYELVSQYKWQLSPNKNTGYASHAFSKKGKYYRLYMHRLITGASADKEVDHINHNGLDNRRANLRVCSEQENKWNRVHPIGKSGFKGVHWYRPTGRWRAIIVIDNRFKHLGIFDDPRDGAAAYDRAAVSAFGDFAVTNRALGLL
jgi:hypothetical protein